VAEQLLAFLGKPKSVIRLVEDRPGHDRRYAVDCRKINRIGWQPTVSFDAGLKATVDWYRQNESGWRPIKSGEFLTYYEAMYAKRLKEGLSSSSSCGF
jgi:dTDP-glucose 4,6-dehydratase